MRSARSPSSADGLIVTAADGTSQVRTITAVAGDVLTLDAAFDTVPTATSSWLIREVGNYNAFALNNVAVRVLDSDAAGVVILPSSGAAQPAVGEGGAGTTYTIQLNRPGIGPVTVALSSLNPGQLTGFPPQVTFNGALSALINVAAGDDPLREGFQFEHIVHQFLTTDRFAGTVAATPTRFDEIAGNFTGLDLRGLHRPHHVRRRRRPVPLHPPQHGDQAVPADRSRDVARPRATRSSCRATRRRLR